MWIECTTIIAFVIATITSSINATSIATAATGNDTTATGNATTATGNATTATSNATTATSNAPAATDNATIFTMQRYYWQYYNCGYRLCLFILMCTTKLPQVLAYTLHPVKHQYKIFVDVQQSLWAIISKHLLNYMFKLFCLKR